LIDYINNMNTNKQLTKATMKKELITILKTAISLIQQENDLDFVLFFIKKSFKKMGVK
jgi:hypothetical protein